MTDLNGWLPFTAPSVSLSLCVIRNLIPICLDANNPVERLPPLTNQFFTEAATMSCEPGVSGCPMQAVMQIGLLINLINR